VASQATDQTFVGSRRSRLQLGKYWPEFLAVLVLVECLAAAAVASHFGVANQIPWGVYYVLWLVPAAAASLITIAVWIYSLLAAREENPFQATVSKLRSFDARSYVELIVPVLVMAPFMASFTTFKTLMENVAPSGIDPMLMRIDGVFGVQPWQVTHAMIGAIGTLILDKMYFVWFGVSQLTLIAVLFVPHLRRHRGQVLLTFVISWLVLGVLLATLMPSVGPCFYGKVYHVDAYADLLRQLNATSRIDHLNELVLQDRLWADHSREIIAVGSGVSAMPSMHVSVATLTALLFRRIGLGWLGALWVAGIWIGSIHLGWHYASDGIVAIIGTVLIWKAVAHVLGQETSRAAIAR
jgi:hypothetical protein